VKAGEDRVVDIRGGDPGRLERRRDRFLDERGVGVLAEALLPLA
jgi:hypothetical protein